MNYKIINLENSPDHPNKPNPPTAQSPPFADLLRNLWRGRQAVRPTGRLRKTARPSGLLSSPDRFLNPPDFGPGIRAQLSFQDSIFI